MYYRISNILLVATCIFITCVFTGCSAGGASRVHVQAVDDIRTGNYADARRSLRRHSLDETSNDIILDNLRLAVASLHDGAFFEATQSLNRVYPYMVAGTGDGETTDGGAFFEIEGDRVWRGEPFEQAGAWYYQTVMHMIASDWENARAATKNMLFTLVDFAGSPTVSEAMEQSESPEWFDENAERIENDLVLGYLLAAIAEQGQGRDTDAMELLDHAVELQPDLEDLVSILRDERYNTLLVVETGRGPVKTPHGDYGEYFTYEPKPTGLPKQLFVSDLTKQAEIRVPDRMDVADFHLLSQHTRWWSLRSLRESKKAIGDILTIAGTGAVIISQGDHDDNRRDKVLIAGLAAILAGQMIASSSSADLRYFDVLPRTVYLVPLNLSRGSHTISLSFGANHASGIDNTVRHNITPGDTMPAVYMIRLDGGTTNDNNNVVHPNDVTGPIVGTYPYILGGTCVCTPGKDVLETYQADGYLLDYTVEGLRDLYRMEGIVAQPLPAKKETVPTYHHILEGGKLLYTPMPGSAGFERLTYGDDAWRYEPVSDAVREVMLEIERTQSGILDSK